MVKHLTGEYAAPTVSVGHSESLEETIDSLTTDCNESPIPAIGASRCPQPIGGRWRGRRLAATL